MTAQGQSPFDGHELVSPTLAQQNSMMPMMEKRR